MTSVQPLLNARDGPGQQPPEFRTRIVPRNKGQRYPADPPTVDEIVAATATAIASTRSLAWPAVEPWLAESLQVPARAELRHVALKAGVGRGFAPHSCATRPSHQGINAEDVISTARARQR